MHEIIFFSMSYILNYTSNIVDHFHNYCNLIKNSTQLYAMVKNAWSKTRSYAYRLVPIFLHTNITFIDKDKVLKKEMEENTMKSRPLPDIPGNDQKRKKRKVKS